MEVVEEEHQRPRHRKLFEQQSHRAVRPVGLVQRSLSCGGRVGESREELSKLRSGCRIEPFQAAGIQPTDVIVQRVDEHPVGEIRSRPCTGAPEDDVTTSVGSGAQLCEQPALAGRRPAGRRRSGGQGPSSVRDRGIWRCQHGPRDRGVFRAGPDRREDLDPGRWHRNDRASHRELAMLRGELIPAAFAGAPDASAMVGGVTAQAADFNARLVTHTPLVFGFVLVAAFLLLLVTFRSLVIALKAIVLNLLSVGAPYGVLMLVFQNGWGEKLLGLPLQRHDHRLAAAVPVRRAVSTRAAMDYDAPTRRSRRGRPAVISARPSPWPALAACPTPSTPVAPSDAPGRRCPLGRAGTALRQRPQRLFHARIIRILITAWFLRRPGRLRLWPPGRRSVRRGIPRRLYAQGVA